MKLFRNTIAGVVLGVTMTASWFVGSNLVRNVEFAHAQERVDASRAQIANVQDMAAVFKAVGKAVENSVVSIDVEKTITSDANIRQFRNGEEIPLPDGLPFEIPQMPRRRPAAGTGSGVIVETDGKVGYIVTNNHVASNATKITITLNDGRQINNGKVLGTDPKTDLAVIKIEADRLMPAKWGDSTVLEKGDIVMAFGSPLGFVGSMTQGIVSALNRDQVGIIRGDFAYENFIQVDAPINPGNSGGPLVNLKGEVVGINTAIASESGGFQGIGFAIPSNQAKQVYDGIKNNGRVVRGWLGVGIADVAKEQEKAEQLGYTEHTGVMVDRIFRDTPAYKKLEVGDVVTAINGKKVANTNQLRATIAGTAPGSEVKLSVFRNKKQEEVTVKVGEQPEDTTSIASAGERNQNRNTNAQVNADSLGVRLSAPNDDLMQRYSLDNDVKGAVVTGVRAGALAARAGLQPGDVITKIDDQSVNSVEDVNNILSKKDLNNGVMLYVTNRESMRSVFVKNTDR